MSLSGIRRMLLLATMTIIAVDTNYYFRTTNMIYSFSEFENRMLESLEQSMIKDTNKRTTPLLVLRVGPGAAGTSILEKALSKGWSEELLRSDQYKFIGIDAMEKSKSYHCNTTITTGCTRVLSTELTDLLEREDQNVIGSNVLLHDLDHSRRRAWVDATGNKRDVNIVVDYVRLHELLPNRYNQEYQRSKKKSNWPGIKGNYITPPFSKYLTNIADLDEHESVRTYQAWEQNFPVSVFNVHQKGDMITNFVCQEVKGANGMCQRLTSKPNAPRKKRNSGSPMIPDYDIMAVHAYEKGLVHPFDNRFELAEAIRDYHKKEKEDLPRKCPSKQALDKLYTASKKFESWALIFGEVSKPVTDFDDSWNNALQSKKLCGVDPKAALEQDVWKSFFRLRYVSKSSQQFYA